jgi:enoyl-[acyl-carrier-protein] reductase (NADH)
VLAALGRLTGSVAPAKATDADGQPRVLSSTDYLESLRQATLLKRFPTLAEVGEAAAFVASDRASATTGAAANITCGQFAD